MLFSSNIIHVCCYPFVLACQTGILEHVFCNYLLPEKDYMSRLFVFFVLLDLFFSFLSWSREHEFGANNFIFMSRDPLGFPWQVIKRKIEIEHICIINALKLIFKENKVMEKIVFLLIDFGNTCIFMK